MSSLEGPDRAAWAKDELTRLIDVEVARLEAVRAGFDHAAIAADRAEAVDRVLFDPSKEAILARKYEAATERALYKALKEFREVEAEAAEGRESDLKVDTDETYDPAALNLEEAEEEASDDKSGSTLACQTASPTILPLLDRAMEGPISVESAGFGPA